MSHEHPHNEPAEYNPSKDYRQFMQWAKWGSGIFILGALGLRFLIG